MDPVTTQNENDICKINRPRKQQWDQFCSLLDKYSLWAESCTGADDTSIAQIHNGSFVFGELELLRRKEIKKRAKFVKGYLLRNKHKRSRSLSSSSTKSDDSSEEYIDITNIKRKIETELKSNLKDVMEQRVKYMNSEDHESFLHYDELVRVETERLEKHISDDELTKYFEYMLYEIIKE